MTDTTPTLASELRAAAEMLRDKATAAIHEGRTTWSTGNTLGSRSPVVLDDPELPSVLIETYAARLERVNSYLALLGPATGLTLADWLDAAADGLTMGRIHGTNLVICESCCEEMPRHHIRPALAAARQILGTTETAPHACDNCDGIDPTSCLTNPNRTAPSVAEFELRGTAEIRAAALREAADEIAGIDFHPNARARSLDIAAGLARRLRHMADEAQPETEAHQHVWATVPASGAYGRLIGHTWTYCGICGQPSATNQPDDDATEEPTR
ncbi:hypothetical protein ACIOHC_11295 [Streptomyces sp. NPDC088252]|uniref:hypothetical protein n=1 Tax=unclassified Streptomyces TaxID=2593676 RepID=UPI0037F43169